MNIGILGQGYVGTAIREGFAPYYDSLNTYDKFLKEKSTVSSLKELVEKSKYIFVCVPTPMKNTGECDTSIVKNEIESINSICKEIDGRIVIIKSTVPPGTTNKLNKINKNINIIFNPEFLTELNFINDFQNQDRIILGGEKKFIDDLRQIYSRVFPNTPIIKTDSKTAEMVKYVTNTFLATKVSYANEIKSLCNEIDTDYDKVIEYAQYDSRLGKSHWAVPGPDGNLGFGGSCFPKDINALIYYGEQLGISMDILKSVWSKNLSVRPQKDWEKLIGRAISEETKD
tara:strand:+ start:530 stop:1387 length:858 start_codon:yes stop_codon:yes gene_type:complete